MARWTTRGTLLGAVLVMASTACLGQSTLATLRGTIVDQLGGVLPGVEVVLTDTATNVVARTLLSADDGSFEIPDLRSGNYRLKATFAGFRTYVADEIRLDAGQIRRLEVRLQIGEVSEQVTVTAGAAVLTTDTATIAS